jgi:hypothetical protein
MLNEKDKYWLAGLLEGEGSFMPGPPSDPNRPRISVQMTDKDVIEEVAELFDLEYIQESNRGPENWKTSYRVQLRGSKAVKIMDQLKPLMGERRQDQIEEALACYNPLFWTEKRSDYPKEKVEEVWSFIQNNEVDLKKVSEKFNVKYQFIKDLKRGKTWTEVTGL